MIAARSAWPPSEDEDQDRGKTSVKSYLLEAHPRDACGQGAGDLLSDIGGQIGIQVRPTDDEDLFRLTKEDAEFWCDTSLGRFWRLHTVAPVQRNADPLHQILVRTSPFLDNVWLPPRYLEELPRRTDSLMQTFSLSHDRRPMHQEGVEGEGFDYVTLRLWASRAAENLKKLRDVDLWPHGVSIRSVRIRSGDLRPDGDFCVAEYFHSGKVTANGTSFDVHNRILVQVLRDYQALVEDIEARFAIGFERHSPTTGHLTGQPIVIPMKWTILDLERAVGRMFSSTEPFRLWGLPEKLGDDRFRVRAVDLHVGSTLTFDISRDHVVVILPRGTCGNTIVRFLGGLHYHVDADAGTGLFDWSHAGDASRAAERDPRAPL